MKKLLLVPLNLLLLAMLMTTAFAQDDPVGYLEDAPRSFLQETPYLTQCELGCVVADGVRDAAGTEVALVNWGDIENDLNQGTVTETDIARVFSQDRTLASAEISPAALFALLEHSVAEIQVDPQTEQVVEGSECFDGFLQVSGLRFRYDASAPAGCRVVQVILEDGRELSPTDETGTITLSATEHMLTGGYGFPAMDFTPLGCSLTDALTGYVSGRTALPEGETQRITLIGARNNLIVSQFPRGALIVGIALLGVFLAFTGLRAKGQRDS